MSKSNNKKSLYLVLGDQLFPFARTPFEKGDQVVMVEDHSLCTHFKYHKNKLLFFLTAMREYRAELADHGVKVTYYDSQHKLFKSSFVDKLKDFFKNNSDIKTLHCYEIADNFFEKQIQSFCKEQSLELQTHKNPMFLTSKQEFKEYLESVETPFMKTFYSMQRKRLDILVENNNQPTGGKWSFDKENRKKYPKNIELPELKKLKPSRFQKDVEKTVEKHFADHPGDTENFWLPTNRQQALAWLREFIDQKFHSFGPYEDAIRSDDTFGFHSALSPLMNIGLLTPDEVIDRIVEKGDELDIPIASVEGYVRQVIGWREFVKGIYDNYDEKMNQDNFWNHKNKLKKCWYDAATGVPPLDDSINKAQKFGYTHHIERLMILSNMMLLCEIEPRQVHRWFMEMYVDSADWVMAANVYGMGQMSEGGIFSTKPYICGSNYIIKMSDYKKGDWCEIVDGLYWRFVDNKKEFFSQNPRMGMMVKMLEKMDATRKKKIFKRAEEFISQVTK